MNRRNFIKLLTGIVTCMSIHPHEFLTPDPLPPLTSRHYVDIIADDFIAGDSSLTPEVLQRAFEFWSEVNETHVMIVHPGLKKQYELVLRG